MSKTVVQLTPSDHGRRMSLEVFGSAEATEGHLFELSRGVVTVVDVPNFRHVRQVDEIREQFSSFRRKHSGRIHTIAGGSDCKIPVEGLESERHPDWAVYREPPPDESDPWPTWIPDIVIEVVSVSSRQRDYEEKPEEYLRFGIREYWIVDEDRNQLLVHRRVGGRWVPRVISPPDLYRPPTPRGFEFDVGAVFEAARA